MVSAGLAAQNPHMISATITAISCLIFEFKDVLPTDVLLEIASTVELFLTHNSREIAKSAIGFVKVEVLSLPEEMVKQNLSDLLSKLMRWSHEHKGHFKSKVKHILERLIRKFGVEEVERCIPEEIRNWLLTSRNQETEPRENKKLRLKPKVRLDLKLLDLAIILKRNLFLLMRKPCMIPIFLKMKLIFMMKMLIDTEGW